jgi:hypothetical protein
MISDPTRAAARRASRGVLVAVAVAVAASPTLARAPLVLRSVGGVPAHVAGMFEEPLALQEVPSGGYLVFDRRAHAVYRIDAARQRAEKVVDIGPETGKVIGPTAFDSGPDGIFVVADAPTGVERLQFFNLRGQRVGGFDLPGRAAPRVILGTLVMSGVGSLQFTGRSVLINQPETGGLITEYGLGGTPVRTIGQLRATGQEADRDVHLALNVGLPLVNPQGGFYFVFLTGEPRFRSYERSGTLRFERLAQGVELDALTRSMPTRWPRRTIDGTTLPLVPPVVRAAGVDPLGRLWVSYIAPVTYVFDADGDLAAKVQFQAAGPLSPTSFSFPDRSRLLVTPGLYEFDVSAIGP